MRWVTATLIVVGLAVGVAVLWPSSTQEVPEDTLAEALTTTTTTAPPADTTTSLPATTTTSEDEGDTHVVETVEEAEEILRELWFGWFEGIYNQDEERIREVVVLEETVDRARESFGIEFERAPETGDISFEGTEILRSDSDCLAVETSLVLTGFRSGSSHGVEVLRWTSDKWKSLSTWTNREDLWEADCESSLTS